MSSSDEVFATRLSKATRYVAPIRGEPMQRRAKSDERGEPSIDALDAHARNVLFEVLANRRRPIAVVGSGLSVVYGGVSWEESVKLAIRFTIERIERIERIIPPGKLVPKPFQEAAVYLDRAKSALLAFEAPKAIDKSSEKYVALDLCSRTLDRIDGLPEEVLASAPCDITYDRGETPTFLHLMAKVYKDDTYFIQRLLIERFGLSQTDAKSIPLIHDIHHLTPPQVQRLGVVIYSRAFLTRLISRSKDAQWRARASQLLEATLCDLDSELDKRRLDRTTTLPIDRRSLLSLFAVGVTPDRKRYWLRYLVKSIKRGNSTHIDSAAPHPVLDPIGKLQHALRVKRFVTLNFDYTLEQRVILDDLHVTGEAPYRLERARKDGVLEADGNTGGLTRRFADGLVASTDIYNARAVGRVFEFALDSSDLRAQILHLHGRADDPLTMLLTDSDSNRQYRRDRASRTSLEQALDVIQTGNPIVFVGIGLSEAEITRALRDLVSRGEPTAFSPVFAIVAVEKPDTTAWRNQLALFQQYGVHVLHAGLSNDRWAGLPPFLGAIDTMLKFIAYSGEPGGGQNPLDAKARRHINALLKIPRWSVASPFSMPAEMAGDRVAAAGLYRELRAAAIQKDRRRNHARPDRQTRERYVDYLNKLKSKLFTLAMIHALDDIEWGWRDHVNQRRLPSMQSADGKPEFLELPQPYDVGRNKALSRYSVRESGQTRVLTDGGPSLGHIVRWRHQPQPFEGPPPETPQYISTIATSIFVSRLPLVVCLSPLGTGKGLLLRHLVKKYDDDRRSVLVINCNFGIEFDSVLSQVLLFFRSTASAYRHFTSLYDDMSERFGDPMHDRVTALRELTQRLNLKWFRKPPVIIFSGIERLIDRRGKPVAPELDLLLSALLPTLPPTGAKRSAVQLVVIGGEDCRKYLDSKLRPAVPDRDGVAARRPGGGPARGLRSVLRPAAIPAWHLDVRWKTCPNPRDTGFLGHLLETAKGSAGITPAVQNELVFAALRSTEATVPNSARSPAIEAVMRVVLDHWHQLAFAPSTGTENAINRLRAQLDQRALGTLAFIGMPIDAGVLDHQHTPGGLLDQIAARLGHTDISKDFVLDERVQSIERLRQFGFVIKLEPHLLDEAAADKLAKAATNTDPAYRIVLHRSAMAEMRERIGVRSGDELLSNSFSTTLALSMPTDLIVPEEAIMRDLKTIVGRLNGGWRDPVLTNIPEVRIHIRDAIDALRKAVHAEIAKSPVRTIDGAVSKFDADALKAERWLRSIDRALRMATADMQANTRAAAGIIRSFFSAASLVAQMPSSAERGDRELGEFEEHKRRIQRLMNRFREAQRALALARRYLSNIKAQYPQLAKHEAVRAVRQLIYECRKRADCERRPTELPGLYGAELVWLLNEHGVIALLQGDLHNAESSFREASDANKVFRNRNGGQVWRRIEINRSLLRIERGRIGEARARLDKIQHDLENKPLIAEEERRVITPLLHNYLGLCEHLAGGHELARRHFNAAIHGLVVTDQQRALAVTYIRRASLHLGLGDRAAARDDVARGVAIAEAGRQMDILWRARVTSVSTMEMPREREQIMTIFRESQRYAKVMQLPRLEVQALRSEAEFYVDQIDDYEYAGALAAQAMTVAARHGMVLQKIALRVLMGRILLRRNDDSGRYLLDRAIAHADRIGYQLQIDRAQRALLEASQRRPN